MNQEKFARLVTMFKEARDVKGENLNMHYFLIKDGEREYRYAFNNRREKSDLRSISKTVMALTAGIVSRMSNEGIYKDFNEDTYIFPIIKDVINLSNKDNEEYLKKIQLKDLLSHRVGYDKVLMMRDDIKDMEESNYLNYLVNSPIVYEPGEYYLYSNAGFYLLSAVLEEFIGEDLITFMERELFTPLGIKDFKWESYGKYLAGATRLWLYPEDLLKIGELMLRDGEIDGRTIVSKDWLDKMLTKYILAEKVDNRHRVFRRYAYGYGIWLAKEDFYFAHGTDGQIMVILPEYDFIIITQAAQVDIDPIEEIVDKILSEKLN